MATYFHERECIAFLKHLLVYMKLNIVDRKQSYSTSEQITINNYFNQLQPAVFLGKELVMFFSALQTLFQRQKKNAISNLEIITFIQTNNIDLSNQQANVIVNKIDNSLVLGDIDYLRALYDDIICQYRLQIANELVVAIGAKINKNTLSEAFKLIDEFYEKKWNAGLVNEIYVTLRENVEEYVKTLQDKNVNEPIGLPTGIRSLDDLIGGLVSSNFIVIAARPSVGKSAFAINLITQIYKENSIKNQMIENRSNKNAVLFISLEMSQKELTWRLIANVASIDSKNVQSKNINEQQQKIIEYNFKQIWKNSEVFLNKHTAVDVDEIEKIINRVKQKYNLQVVVIDYLQLMTGIDGDHINREQQVARISRRLKLIAMRQELCVIALSQLSRRIEQRESKVPVLSDLRESGAIEQDADIIIFLYHEPLDEKDKEKDNGEIDASSNNTNIVLAKVGKNRNGPVGTIRLFFDKRLQQFREIKQGWYEAK